MPLRLPVRRLAHAADLPLPAYASSDAAGLDLLAALTQDLELAPGGRALIPTGIAVALPPGFEGQIRPRSGLALDYGLTVLNAPGTIDADYRGEIGVILINLGQTPVTLVRGMRIAQLVIAPYCGVAWDERADTPDHWTGTSRGTDGFGSTGTV